VITEKERDAAMSGLEVWKKLELVHALVSGELDRALESNHGLSLHTFELLSAIASAPQKRLRMSELATRLQITRSGVTRLVERLERDNFVVRARDSLDRRVVHARMTARGSAKLHDATDTYCAVVSELFAHRKPHELRRPSQAGVEPLSEESRTKGANTREVSDLVRERGKVIVHFKIVRQRDDRFHWELINPHGTPAMRSMGTFDTEDEAATNVESARRLITEAPLIPRPRDGSRDGQ
jgi:DNA-binding MarR family transcriptional regulator